MSNRINAAVVAALTLLASPLPALGQESAAAPVMLEVAAAELAFGDIEVPGFASGMKIATVYGDPSVADEPYTIRLAFPDGYAFPPHWHPRAENVTVLEGEFLLSMGREFDDSKLKIYRPGDYLYIAAKNPHFGKAKGRTVIQLHGIGPFAITVVEGQEMSPVGGD